MRDLRFRAWDKNSKKMIVFTNNLSLENTGGFWGGTREVWRLSTLKAEGEPKSGRGYFHDDFAEQIEDFILMQYTGLKDCKGREIYEGDIIKGIGAVEYDCGRFWVGESQNIDEVVASSEIIGNIYENKDLLL